MVVFPPPLASPGPHVLFDNFGTITGWFTSQELNREAPNAIIEVFPTIPGSLAIVQVVDAGPFGSLTPCTDSNGYRPSIDQYTKFMVKGVMDRVATQINVEAGAWSVWLTFVQEASDRSAYWDRNPSTKVLAFSQGLIGPHGSTERGIYMVPSGRKAWIDSNDLFILRDGATSTPGMTQAFTRLLPAGTVIPTTLTFVAMLDGTLGASVEKNSGQVGPILPGDQIDIATLDESTGGTCWYNIGFKITEFDF